MLVALLLKVICYFTTALPRKVISRMTMSHSKKSNSLLLVHLCYQKWMWIYCLNCIIDVEHIFLEMYRLSRLWMATFCISAGWQQDWQIAIPLLQCFIYVFIFRKTYYLVVTGAPEGHTICYNMLLFQWKMLNYFKYKHKYKHKLRAPEVVEHVLNTREFKNKVPFTLIMLTCHLLRMVTTTAFSQGPAWQVWVNINGKEKKN